MIVWSFIQVIILTFQNLVKDCSLKLEFILECLKRCSRYKMKGGKKRKKNIGKQEETRFP